MTISYQKAFYFWHRYLEEFSPEDAVVRWNKGYPEDPATAEEIEQFLAEMVNRKEAGQKESVALYCIVTGQEVLEGPEPLAIPDPPAKPHTTIRKQIATKLKVSK